MTENLKKFILRLTVFTAILGMIYIILRFVLPEENLSPAIPFMLPYFFLLTVLVFYILTKNPGAAFSNFVNHFMVAIFGKMILCIIVLLAYVFANKSDAVPFILSFFVLYIFYSVYEVAALLKYPFPGKQ